MFIDSFSISAVAIRWLQLSFGIMLVLAALLMPLYLPAQTTVDSVDQLQHEWDTIRYQTAKEKREDAFAKLSSKAHQGSLAHPNDPKFLVWEGIIVSSWAGEKGGLGALGLVKQAKQLYEQAIAIQPSVLEGSAYSSLGVLYYKVPGWPLGFGDKAKAEELLKKGLELNPNGLDANFFYAEYLFETGKYAQARTHAERALNAPPRTGRKVADLGRQEEVRELLVKLEGKEK